METSELKSASLPSSADKVGSFPERLKAAVGERSIRSFASACGMSDTVVHQYLSGKTEPTRPVLIMLAAVSGVNPGWLLTGDGFMRPTDGATVNEDRVIYADAADLEKEYVLVPRYNVKVSTGGGSLVDSEQVVDHLAFKSVWIRNIMRLNPADLLLVSAMGDSMYPTIKAGDLLLVDKGQREVRDDAIYILQMDGSLIAKRVQKLYDGSVQIKSDNKVYDAQLVPSDRVSMLNIIGRVVWVGGKI